jgi:predicted NBD/HSP70 family sugar kinase
VKTPETDAGATLAPYRGAMDPVREIPPAFLRRSAAEAASPSERQALDVIRREGVITRADIARRIGLTGMSMTRIIDGLERRGLVRSTGRIGAGRGPKIGVELVPDAAYSIGVAIKADAVAVTLMDLSGAVLTQGVTLATGRRQPVSLDTIVAAVEAIIVDHVPDRRRLFGLGVAITGFFIGQGTRVNPPAQLDEWALVDVDAILHERLGLPVWVDNDGNAAAEAEAMFGVGRWARTFAYLYFSTGFGGGIVHEGKLLRGRNGNAGEFAGSIPLEGFVHPNLENLRLMLAEDGIAIETVSQMVERFDPSWPAIDVWLNRVGPALNIAASAASAVLDPDAIVLGGQLPRALAERMIPLIQFSSGLRRGYIRPVPVVVRAEAATESPAIGAAAIPLREHFFSG